MAIGMKFHHYADPKPPRPSFKVVIPSRISKRAGTFKLIFYVPEAYYDNDTPEEYRFPLVVNFHGGGFTLGTGTDDARWAATVVHNTEAVLVSVEYRLAPEFPFSTGVEDCTDALIYLAAHAEELRLDPHRIGLSGFSAGGNFVLTVPLMLHDLQNGKGRRKLNATDSKLRPPMSSRPSTATHTSSTTYLNAQAQSLRSTQSAVSLHSSNLSVPSNRPFQNRSAASSTHSILKLSDLEPTLLELEQKVPDLTIRCLVAFYPPTDFRIPRDVKRRTNPCPEKNLPPLLTNLFDQSYILNANPAVDLSDPYLSPAAAEDEQLRAAYPDDIVLYTCEYDMLNVEGIAFGERLKSEAVDKTVHGGLVKASVHAFDKKPNPLSFPSSADRCYSETCAELKRIFGGRASFAERRQLDLSKDVERFEEVTPFVKKHYTTEEGSSSITITIDEA